MPVEVRQPDGTTTQEVITYPPAAGAPTPGDVTIKDVSEEQRVAWHLAEVAERETST